MKVSELIRRLSKLDPDTVVLTGYEGFLYVHDGVITTGRVRSCTAPDKGASRSLVQFVIPAGKELPAEWDVVEEFPAVVLEPGETDGLPEELL